MITYNTYFENKEELKLFLENNNINDSKKILCQVFTSIIDKQYIKNLIFDINTLLPSSVIIGSTTAGEIMNEEVSSFKTVISISIFEKTNLEYYISEDFENYYTAGINLTKVLNKKDLKVIISFMDGLSGTAEEYLEGILSVNKEVKIAGGLAADMSEFNKTYIFSKDKILEQGVIGVGLYSDQLIVNTDYSFNWTPIGKELEITKAEGNIVYEIDNKNAYDTYKYYFGEENAQKLPDIGLEFPLVLQRGDLSVSRVVLKNNNDGSLSFAGNFYENEKVKFAYGHTESILSNTNINAEKLSKVPVQSIFVYSCMARRRFLDDSIKFEIEPYYNIAPVSGFFTYGEFYTDKKVEFMNQTMTVLALSETNEIKNSYKSIPKEKSSKSNTLSVLTHLIDISSKEIEAQKEKALKASKIKDVFLANMSHELKTPLNSINIISSVMKKNKHKNLEEKQITNLEVINKSGNFLLNMIEDVLDLSKLEAGDITINIEKVEFQNEFRSLVNMLKPQFREKKLSFDYHIDKSIDLIYTDIMRINQIIKNLISNSLKFTKKGNISLEILDLEDKFEIVVKDEGIGIEKEKMEIIFDRFKQAEINTSKKYGGTGLGLSIVKELVKLLNGEVKLESEIGLGTTVKIILPKNLIVEDEKCPLDRFENQKNQKLLFLNNNPMKFFKLFLELKKDYEIIQVNSENDFINELKNSDISKVLLDIDKIQNKEDILKLIANRSLYNF